MPEDASVMSAVPFGCVVFMELLLGSVRTGYPPLSVHIVPSIRGEHGAKMKPSIPVYGTDRSWIDLKPCRWCWPWPKPAALPAQHAVSGGRLRRRAARFRTSKRISTPSCSTVRDEG